MVKRSDLQKSFSAPVGVLTNCYPVDAISSKGKGPWIMGMVKRSPVSLQVVGGSTSNGIENLLSSFKPVKTLKNDFKVGGNLGLRKIFVIIQFVLTEFSRVIPTTGLSLLTLTLLVISSQTVRTALTSPVDALKYE